MADGVLFVAALMCVTLGIPMSRWPREVARLNEIIDAIGQKPAGPVEPADWEVSLTRILGVGLTIAAVVLVVRLVL